MTRRGAALLLMAAVSLLCALSTGLPIYYFCTYCFSSVRFAAFNFYS